MNHGTDNNNETDANTTLTYQALDPLKADVFGGQPYKIWTSADEGFDEATMMGEVFGGYKAASSVPGK